MPLVHVLFLVAVRPFGNAVLFCQPANYLLGYNRLPECSLDTIDQFAGELYGCVFGLEVGEPIKDVAVRVDVVLDFRRLLSSSHEA